MTLMQKFFGATAALALSAGAALAEPALIFDLGGKFAKSFNEPAANSLRSSCNPKHNANKRCAALPKLARIQ